MKIYRILKRYPTLDKHFQVDDIVYFYPMEFGEYSIYDNAVNIPAKLFVYKKLFHQQNDPFIARDAVEGHPDYFQLLELNNIEIKL